jgi:hypothetical protein
MTYIFDEIEDYTENYKIKIRGADYDELVRGTTNESITFIFNENNENNMVVVTFDVDFFFSFEDGFDNVKFSNFKFNFSYFEYPKNMKEELTKYIKENFINVDRLSE